MAHTKNFLLDALLTHTPIEFLDWQPEAACKDQVYAEGDYDTYFPGEGQNVGTDDRTVTAKAKRVCAGCPVRINCLHHVMHHPEGYGVWGGLSTGQRREIRKEYLNALDRRARHGRAA